MLLRILFGVLTILLASTTLPTSGQSNVGSANVDRKTRQQLEETAQSFVEAYRKRRNFAYCFQAFFVSDAVERMKRAEFFKSMELEPDLIQSATNDELARAYVAMMNYHFASVAYEFNHPAAPVPQELTSHKVEYRYLSSVISSGVTTAVATKQDLARFTREFEHAADVYRRLLPSYAFDSSAYKSRIAHNRNAETLDKLDGLPDFGVPNGTAVFALSKDMFDFYFINDHGHYRVLTLGLD